MRIETEFESENSNVGLDEWRWPYLDRLAASYRRVPVGRGILAEPAAEIGRTQAWYGVVKRKILVRVMC